MNYIGIDPGKKGAIAILGDIIYVHSMPVVTGRKSRVEYDVPAIVDLLRQYRGSFVTVERAQPMPGSPERWGKPDAFRPSASAQFNRGVQRAGFEWALVALQIPFQLVPPPSWMKVMHLGATGKDTKRRSVEVAQRLFPSVDLRRSQRARKPDDGIAEALLLAEYGRRTRNGSN